MKKSLHSSVFAFIAAFFFTLSAHAQDSWTPVETSGFGNSFDETVKHMIPFKGQIYAGVGNSSGKVYRSATGNAGSWTNVFADTNTTSVNAMAVSNDGAGYIYMYSSTFGVKNVYSSTNGDTWAPYFTASNDILEIVPFKGTGAVDSIY